jgi:chromosome segregation ATPase
LENELKFSNQQIGQLQLEKTLLERKFEKEHRDVSHYKEMAESSKVPLILAQTEIDGLKSEILNMKRIQNEIHRQYEQANRDKEKQSQVVERAEQRAKENIDLINEHTRIENELASEVTISRNEIIQLKKAISQLERDREKLNSEIILQRENYLSGEEEIKIKDAQIKDLHSKTVEFEHKMKHQLQLYETIRLEKNELSKNLMEAQDELTELKKNSKLLTHQVNQLKDEISVKEQVIAKEQFECSKIEKLKESLQNELSHKNHMISSDHHLVEEYEAEIKKLTASVRTLDDELLLQKREYDKLISEKDITGLQLIRRNDEIALLCERIRTQDASLKAGQEQYFERLNDIQLLKGKIRDLTREYNLSKHSGTSLIDMKNKIVHLEKDLSYEKNKVAALSEELQNPLNVHRWRKLEGSDPTSYELIQKVHILQKKLILKTEEVVETNLILQDKEKIEEELKNLIARQPGPEIGDQVNTFQRNLRAKSKQMKVLAAELNMYQAQAAEYKYEVERLNREVADLKRKYYQQKQRRDANSLLESTKDNYGGEEFSENFQNKMSSIQKLPKTRFTGGGFAIKIPTSQNCH